MNHHLLLATGAAAATQETTFWVLAIVAGVAGLGMVLARKAVHCAVLLAVVMLSLAVLYALAGAPFLAFVQIIVYTGAVLMLFLFVLMIVGVTSADALVETIRGQRVWAGLADRPARDASPGHRPRGDRPGRRAVRRTSEPPTSAAWPS